MLLRPYQQAAVDAVLTARRRGVRRQVVALPTGAGKTVIFSELARLARRPVLVLAHRAELVEQAADKLARALGDRSLVGIEQASVAAPAGTRAVVASIRSLSDERLARLAETHDFGLVIYDECHHAPADDNTRVLEALGATQPDWAGTLVGFTATTSRGDGRGLDAIFDELVFSLGIDELIDQGFLAPLRGFRIATAADLRNVHGGADFDEEELALAIDIEDRNVLVARSIQELARDRRTIAFCVTVAHASHLARALNALGVRTGIVHGALPRDARQSVLADFRAQKLQALTNVGVLTEGFDDPGVSCIAMARPTRSEGLYAQCVGRGTRLFEGKKDCLVLDFVDLADLSLQTLPGLAGLPRDLDLEGNDTREASRTLQRIWFDAPGFEIEAGAITLGEIQRRAAAFDPLTLGVDPEVTAISPFAWESLGSRGVALHWFGGPRSAADGRLSEVLVLRTGARGRKWTVTRDGKAVARFTHIEEAVEATDFEVRRQGRVAESSAFPRAAWRHAPVPARLQRALLNLPRRRAVTTWGDAVAVLCHAEHGPRSGWSFPHESQRVRV